MSLFERIEKYTAYEPNTGCWLWTGSTTRFGYGEIRMKDYPRVVHRLRYEQQFGPIPKGLFVLHICDNPLCSNPYHMFLGTKTENNIDRHKKGRTYKGPKKKSDPIQVKTIRSLKYSPLTYFQIAKYFRVKVATISKIIRRETHARIT